MGVQEAIDFGNRIWFLFGVIGTLSTIAVVFSFVRYVLPSILCLAVPAFRFGQSIAWKKVFIISSGDTLRELRGDLGRSGIIKKRNIITKTKGEMSDLDGARLLILDYAHLGETEVLEVVSHKDSNCGVLVYAETEVIPKEVMRKLNLYRHVSVVNFRGRLINEILLLLVSTSFTRKDAEGQSE